ncbi:MAG TPA: TraR/DksA family transcriptional regulator [Burkholderiales bacterium]|nr:TraR/DksA family transcriptional regulator [Burkholderiales bacterium]
MTLSDTQTTRLARVLDQLEAEVRDKIRTSMPQLADQKYIDLVGVVYDTADEASANMQDEVDHTLLEHYLQKLKQLEAARERLADGALNACADCGDEIGFGRLRAYPFATRCIHCQTVREQTHGGEASSRS